MLLFTLSNFYKKTETVHETDGDKISGDYLEESGVHSFKGTPIHDQRQPSYFR